MVDAATVLEELANQRRRFAYRPDIGDPDGLIVRLLRYYMGNPISDFNVTSSNFSTPNHLPNESRAMAVLLTVTQSPGYFSDGGTTATSNIGHPMQIGERLIITGQESIHGFSFVSQLTGPCVLIGTWFD